MPEKDLILFLLGAATSFTLSTVAVAYTVYRRNKYLSETHTMTPEAYKALYDKKIESYREHLKSQVVYDPIY